MIRRIVVGSALVAAVVLGVVAPVEGAEPRDDVVCDGERTTAGTVVEDVGSPVPAGLPPVVAPVPTPTGVEQILGDTVEVTLDADGGARVQETIVYDFGRATDRHGIRYQVRVTQPCNSRWERTYPLRDVTVSSPSGAPVGVATESAEGVMTLRIGDADKLVDGVHTYVIGYHLAGVVNPFDDRDELYWNAIGPGWDVMVWNAVVRVAAPADPRRVTCYEGRTGSTSPCSAANLTDGVAGFQSEWVAPNEALTVALAYPKGTFANTPRYFEERWSLDRAFSRTPLTVGGAGVLLAGVVAGAAALAYSIGRDRRAVGSPTDVAFAAPGTEGVRVGLLDRERAPVDFAPPDGVRPAQLALVRNEEVADRDVAATIVDLAVRGYVRIEEIGEGRQADYRLVRLRDSDDALLTYERTLLTKLFPGSTTDVTLSDLEDTFASKLHDVEDAVYRDAVGRGWFGERPDKVVRRWRAIGFLVTIVGAGLLTAAIIWTEVALLPVPVVVAGLLVWLLAPRFPRRTPAGTGLRRRIGGFEEFLRDSEAPRARWAEQRNIFSEYLPFAIVLGIATRWARTFEPLGTEALAATTVWYVGHEPFSADRFGRATESFAAAASSTLSSVPQSSSGSSGFSGGSAGGGGGGTGGGSW